ncbi:transposase [Nonomuraea ferruginea]
MRTGADTWKIRTGAAWRDVPPRYGSWQSLYTRFRRGARDGTFTAMPHAVQARADAHGDIDGLVAVDSTIVRAHQHAAGARKGGLVTGSPADHALGRSRGGLTSKIHLVCEYAVSAAATGRRRAGSGVTRAVRP